jgi:diketogulonate reductase-like aldo/keto reductase
MKLTTISGIELCPIGIGTWTMGGERERVVDTKRDHRDIDAISYSLSIGQNHIDTAELYGDGHADELIAEAMKSALRQDVFIANKLWESSFGDTETRDAVSRMLDRLKTDYIDLLYIHWTFGKNDWKRSIDPINDLIDEGIVHHFGVSNFTVEDMTQAQKLSTAPIAANQVECNVQYRDDADEAFVGFCDSYDILRVAYKPINRGEVATDSVIKEIAHNHNATPSQIALAWLLAKDYAVIPKSSDPRHIDENFGSIEVRLTESDIQRLDAL